MITTINPYLVLNGDGQEAVKFYEHALNAEILEIQTFGDMPDPEFPIPEEAKDRIMHANLKVGNTSLMLSDTFPGQLYQLGSQVAVTIMVNDPEKTKEVFEKLKQGGNVHMELQETFWSPLFGQVTDKYGVNWQLSTE